MKTIDERSKVKTIDVNAKEWFDKQNGNSYFSAQIIINYGMEDESYRLLPFQYGYGNHYLDMARELLFPEHKGCGLSFLCREQNIILRHNKAENQTKKDVKSWGE